MATCCRLALLFTLALASSYAVWMLCFAYCACTSAMPMACTFNSYCDWRTRTRAQDALLCGVVRTEFT